MAIKKLKTLKNGITGDYWRITKEVLDRDAMICTWSIALYKDQESRQDGKEHLGLVKQYALPVTNEELLGDRTQLGYTKIKQKAETMVPRLFGQIGPSEVIFDADLAEGEDV